MPPTNSNTASKDSTHTAEQKESSLCIKDKYKTDQALIEMLDKRTGLTHIDVSGCIQLTDASIIEIANRFPGLTHLNVSGCSKLTDDSIKAIANKCPGLSYLNVGYSRELTVV